MTLSEFKAWFEGYTEDMNKSPTEKQWKKIKKRVAEINGVVITREVFLGRYSPWYGYPAILTGSSGGISSTETIADCQTYSSTDAMYALGKSEATTG